MTVIAVRNQKGGSGMNSMAINLSGDFTAGDMAVLPVRPGLQGQRPGPEFDTARPVPAQPFTPCPRASRGAARRPRFRGPGHVHRRNAVLYSYYCRFAL